MSDPHDISRYEPGHLDQSYQLGCGISLAPVAYIVQKPQVG
jgi:hypothetical protein